MPEAGTMTLTVEEEEEDDEEGLHGHGGSMEVLTLPVALDRVGWGPFHWKFVVQCGLSWSCDMIEIALLSFLIPMVISGPAALPSSTPSPGFLLGGGTFAGQLLGSLLFGVVSDLKGRRIGYLASTALIALAGLLCAASQNVETLVALRFFVGLGRGGVTCAFTLLSEVVGSAHRGKRIILSMGLLWTAGGVFATGAAWALDALIPDPNWQWRALVMVSAAPSLLLLLLFPWLVESPRFHLGAGKRGEAEKTVRKIALANRTSAFPRNFRQAGRGGENGQEDRPCEPNLGLSAKLPAAGALCPVQSRRGRHHRTRPFRRGSVAHDLDSGLAMVPEHGFVLRDLLCHPDLLQGAARQRVRRGVRVLRLGGARNSRGVLGRRRGGQEGRPHCGVLRVRRGHRAALPQRLPSLRRPRDIGSVLQGLRDGVHHGPLPVHPGGVPDPGQERGAGAGKRVLQGGGNLSELPQLQAET